MQGQETQQSTAYASEPAQPGLFEKAKAYIPVIGSSTEFDPASSGRQHQEGRLYQESPLPQESLRPEGQSPSFVERAKAYVPSIGASGTTASGYDVSFIFQTLLLCVCAWCWKSQITKSIKRSLLPPLSLHEHQSQRRRTCFLICISLERRQPVMNRQHCVVQAHIHGLLGARTADRALFFLATAQDHKRLQIQCTGACRHHRHKSCQLYTQAWWKQLYTQTSMVNILEQAVHLNMLLKHRS